MPKRITADVDMAILRDIGMGMRNIDIAENYGVSPSYVSKLKTGKKVPDVYTADAGISVYTGKEDIVQWLELKIQEAKHDLHIYSKLLNKVKEND